MSNESCENCGAYVEVANGFKCRQTGRFARLPDRYILAEVCKFYPVIKQPELSEFEKAWQEYTGSCLPGAYSEYAKIAAEATWQACRERFVEKCHETIEPNGNLIIGDIEKIAAELDAEGKK